jgi:hypothetical protein
LLYAPGGFFFASCKAPDSVSLILEFPDEVASDETRCADDEYHWLPACDSFSSFIARVPITAL